MAEHTVELKANAGIFEGLSKQNMQFHQCAAELIDNAIAAKDDSEQFGVHIYLNPRDDESEDIDLYITDDCGGMEFSIFKDALQLGESATTDSRLNEHGFGLKNALATLSGGNNEWTMWTSPGDSDDVYKAVGPFESSMVVDDDSSFPSEGFLPSPSDISTLIHVPVKLSLLQTVQGRGAPAKDLNKLRQWLIEHLGVLYRGYLEQDTETGQHEGTIHVGINTDRVRVPPIKVPIANANTQYFDVELSGEVYTLEYEYGSLDDVRVESLVRGENAKYYYQGNQPKQGIDIRLGKRTIATHQFESIWRTEDDEKVLSRHNRFNDFVGELRIPQLPRGVLTTTNNKTDFNMDDEDWQKIFDKLNEYRPIENIREKTEGGLRDEWIDRIESTNPTDSVTDERSVWPTGTRIDVHREDSTGTITIYELKAGSGSPQHLYQLKMYWDGLVLEDDSPNEGILLVESYNRALEDMVNKINTELADPDGDDYNLRIQTHSDVGLE